MPINRIAATLVRFGVFFTLAVMALALVMLLGYDGPWYLAWISGITMTVLLTAASAVYLDEQEMTAGDVKEPEPSADV